METIIVKINRESIRENPQVGATSFSVAGKQEIRFKIEGEIPSILKEDENCVITRSYFGLPKITEGVLFTDDLINELLKHPGVSIESLTESNRVFHHPSPKYLFEYLPTLVVCESCNKGIEVNDIIEDYDDDGNQIIQCPNCLNYFTFPTIKYEKIEDVLKT